MHNAMPVNEMRPFDRLRINCYGLFNHRVAVELSVATILQEEQMLVSKKIYTFFYK